MNTIKVDEFLFEKYFQIWKAYVEKESGEVFISFSSNSKTSEGEGYKENFILPTAWSKLDRKNWKVEDIGTGKLLKRVIHAIEIKGNNLLPWDARYGEDSKPHVALCKALGTEKQKRIEQIFFDLYKNIVEDSISFDLLINEVGKKYSLMAYLFFLKDKQKYAPIATTYFDSSFNKLGIDFTTSHKCSWENYSTYNDILSEIKYLLSDRLQVDVSLLDTHTFVWMLSGYPIEEGTKSEAKKIIDDYNNSASEKEKEAVIKARIGQGIFRKKLLNYWDYSCAISGCAETSLLIASHIKPWRDCSNFEVIDYYNGILLTPNYDKLFDCGYISFDNNGNIILSNKLNEKNLKILGVDKNAKLKRIEEQHKVYLKYHRQLFGFEK